MMVGEQGWRRDRLLDERFRLYIPVVAAFLFGLLIAGSILNWGEAVTGAIFAGLLVFIATFMKPEWALIVLAFFAPLATTTQGWGTLLPGTGLTPLNALALLLVIGTFLQRYSTSDPSRRATAIDKILLLYIGWSAFSVVVGLVRWGYDSQAVGEWVAMATSYLVYWMVRRRWRSDRLVSIAVFVVLTLLVYEAWTVHRQYSSMDTSAFTWVLKDTILGTFANGNSNDIGCYLSVYCLVGLGLFLALKNVFWRWLAFGAFLAGGMATFETYSRASYFALGAGLVAITVVKHRRWLVPAIIAVLVVPSLLPSSIQGRMDNTNDASATSRKEMWKHGILVMMQNPIGLGWRGYSKNEAAAGARLRDPHNMYVIVGAEQGPIGFVLFIGMLITAGNEMLIAATVGRSPFARGLASGMFGAVVAYGVNNIFGSRMIFVTNMEHFFFLLGLTVIAAYPPIGEPEPVVVEEPVAAVPKPVSPWRYRSYV